MRQTPVSMNSSAHLWRGAPDTVSLKLHLVRPSLAAEGTPLHGSLGMTSLETNVSPQSGLQQMCLAMRPELKRFLLARGCSQGDADDLLQDLFIRIETTTTGPIRTPRAYLYQMVNNMAHTRRRTETRRQARDAEWIDARQGADEVDKTPNPETALGDRDELARVEAHLRALPERTGFIFRQYRIEGASQKAIAEELGISLSAVEKHLQRAYKAVLAIRQDKPAALAAPDLRDGRGR